MSLSKVTFSHETQILEIPMGKLNIKQRISAIPAEEPVKPVKFDVVENKTIQEDRWDTFNEDHSCYYALMIEAITVYMYALKEAFEIYNEIGFFDESVFDAFDAAYNEYLDFIEEDMYDDAVGAVGDAVGAVGEACDDPGGGESRGKYDTKVPYTERDDISSINSDDSCRCRICSASSTDIIEDLN